MHLLVNIECELDTCVHISDNRFTFRKYIVNREILFRKTVRITLQWSYGVYVLFRLQRILFAVASPAMGH